MPTTLIEREGALKEFRLLLSSVARMPPGTSAAFLVTGRWGVGKTAVLAAALDETRRRGFQAAGPINGPDLACRSSPVDAANAVPVDPTTGGEHPAAVSVVAVDDADGVDPDDLRRAVNARRVPGRPATVWLLGASCRSLAGTLTVDQARCHKLTELTEEGATELVTTILGAPPSAGLRAVTRQAGGNPLLLTELLLGLQEEAAVTAAHDGRIRLLRHVLPERVTAAVRRRLGTVSGPCRHLLQVASVQVATTCPLVLAGMIDTTAGGVLPLLTEATEAGLLAPSTCAVSFANTLIRRTVADTVPVALTTALQRQARETGGRLCTCAATAAVTSPPAGRAGAWETLTRTEQTIASLAAEGLTNSQIARRVFLSPHTVNYHLRRVFRKLDVTSRVELVKVRHGAQRTTCAGVGR